MNSSLILRHPGGKNIIDKVNIFKRIRFTNIFGNKNPNPSILDGVKISGIIKANEKVLVKKKEKAWWEKRYDHIQTTFWNKMFFRSLICIGKGLTIIFPGALYIPKMIQMVEIVGPSVTVVVAKILACAGGRSIGWVTGTWPWSSNPTIPWGNKIGGLLTNKETAEIPQEPIFQEMKSIVKEAIAPELQNTIKEEIVKTASEVGLGEVSSFVWSGITLGVLIKGLFEVNKLENLTWTNVGNVSTPETWIAIALLTGTYLGFKGIYKWWTNPNVKVTSEVKQILTEGMSSPKKEAVEFLIDTVNKKNS
jgi:hypothetical protein